MGLFGKSKKEKNYDKLNQIMSEQEVSRLPELPELEMEFGEDENSLPQLPTYPSNSLGEKFSQNIIKEVVSGRKGGDEVSEADEFPTINEEEMMRKPLTREISNSEFKKPLKLSREIPREFREASKIIREEPIFVRIDKFEESVQTFEKIKEKIFEMEKMLQDTKRIKEEEEKEMGYWEREMKIIKENIEDLDREIFSKIE